MSVKEVALLRKQGKLREAYSLAIEDLKEEMDDPWAQMSLFWVLRDICQQHCNNNATEKAKKCLNMMASYLPTMMDDSEAGRRAYDILRKRLQPESNIILNALELSKTDATSAFMQVKGYIASSNNIDVSSHEDLGWIIYRYIKASYNELSSLDIRKLLRDYINLKNERPSLLHSQILNFALGFSKEHSDFSFYRFFILWNPQNLRTEDLYESYYNGKSYPSFISRICRQFASSYEDIDIQLLCESIDLSKEAVLDLLREPLFWNIMALQKEGKNREVFDLLSAYNQKHSSWGPSHWHSQILSLAERYMTEQEVWRFIHFFKEWGYENLRIDDWKEETDNNGNTYKSLAIKSARKCFDILKDSSLKNGDLLLWLDSLYDEVIVHTKDEWILRQRAIIYIWLQKYDSAITIYKSLLLEMSEKYYIWSELADCIQDNNELKISLYSKALLLEKNEEFIGQIRLSLASTLFDNGLLQEALCELNSYNQSHDKVSPKYLELSQKMECSNSCELPKNNYSLYFKYSSVAEDFVYSDIEAKTVSLVDKWEKDGKKFCVFTNANGIMFQVKEKRFPMLAKADLGTVFNVKCREEFKSNTDIWGITNTEYHYTPLSMKKCDAEKWSVFPVKFGFVEYKNEDKKILHIISQNSTPIFQEHKKDWQIICKKDFITYREYSIEQKGEKRYFARNIKKVDKEIALQQFKTSVIAIDDVNIQKELFHYTFGQGRIGGIVYFDETELRPEPGQCLKISYCVSKDKKGNKKAIVLDLKETDEINPKAIKTIRGWLELKYKNSQDNGLPDFAFIGDYYVHKSILEQYNISKDCEVTATAVYAGDNKWKIVKIFI